VARNIFIQYADSDVFGTKEFAAFMERKLKEEGVVNLAVLMGSAKTRAEKANQTYILEQRAEMRGRLVQAAMANKLAHGQALLEGFGASTGIDLTTHDEEPDEE